MVEVVTQTVLHFAFSDDIGTVADCATHGGDLEQVRVRKKERLPMVMYTANTNNRSERTNVKVCSLNKSQNICNRVENNTPFFNGGENIKRF